MAERSLSDVNAFRKVLNGAQNIVAYTGAGIDPESIICIFSGARTRWKTFMSHRLTTPMAFEGNPGLVWEFFHYGREVAFDRPPNNAHKALAAYEQLCKAQGRKFTVITQNVDGLHRRAGSEAVLELLGSLDKVACTKCKNVEQNLNRPICEALRGKGAPEIDSPHLPILKKDLPKCTKCRGLLRPYVLLLDEDIDPKVLNAANEAMQSCDLCFVIGTSSMVYPAAWFTPRAVERGQPVAEFNLYEDPHDIGVRFRFTGLCETTLPEVLGV